MNKLKEIGKTAETINIKKVLYSNSKRDALIASRTP